MKKNRTKDAANTPKKNDQSNVGLLQGGTWGDIVFPIETVPLSGLLSSNLTIFDPGRSTALVAHGRMARKVFLRFSRPSIP